MSDCPFVSLLPILILGTLNRRLSNSMLYFSNEDLGITRR